MDSNQIQSLNSNFQSYYQQFDNNILLNEVIKLINNIFSKKNSFTQSIKNFIFNIHIISPVTYRRRIRCDDTLSGEATAS